MSQGSIQIPEAMLPLWTEKHPETGESLEHYALFGGRGGGKSHGIAEAIAAKTSQGYERVVCGRQFQNSIKDSVKDLIQSKINKLGMAVYYTFTEREIVNDVNGSRYSFIGMDRNPESAKSLEGATIFWGEEAQTFTLRSVELIIPTIRAPGSRMIWSWNPRYRTDAVDDLFRGKAPPEASYIKHIGWRDNPWFYQTRMPSERRRMLKAKPKRYVHIWDGGYDENPDAAIFTDWSIGRPSFIPEKSVPRFGMDFGFSNDPAALIKSYLIEEAQTIYVAQEAYGVKVPNSKLVDFMEQVTEVRDHVIIGDSSRPETIEYIQSAGFAMYGARKGAGSVKNGLTWLQGYHILVDPECVNFAEEIRQYTWKLDPAGMVMAIPAEKQADHGIDALRYGHEEDSTGIPHEEDGGVDYM